MNANSEQNKNPVLACIASHPNYKKIVNCSAPCQSLWVLFVTVAILELVGCGTTGQSKTTVWRFDQGIGIRVDGPQILTLRGIGFDYPKGTRQNWWQANAGVDSFSRLDEIFSASVSPTSAPVQAWRRQTPELTLTYQGAAALAKKLEIAEPQAVCDVVRAAPPRPLFKLLVQWLLTQFSTIRPA